LSSLLIHLSMQIKIKNNLLKLVNERFKDLKTKEEKIDPNRKDWVVKDVNGENMTL